MDVVLLEEGWVFLADGRPEHLGRRSQPPSGLITASFLSELDTRDRMTSRLDMPIEGLFFSRPPRTE